uniref:non-specific protein-tyrosine kinase n=1 Tax=Timema cristinae TaxID=61476 RepID=A0A7R9GVC0_TIMCR|nr:unnamed protein product [Timema cristinae]
MRIRLSLDNVISAPKWYFGKIKRIEAEKKLLLPENDHGAFLIRDSESRRNDYSLSVRDGDTVKHYRIRQLDEGGFFIARRTTFRTLQELVEHYSKDADGLCVNLRKPCIRDVKTALPVTNHRNQWRITYLASLPFGQRCQSRLLRHATSGIDARLAVLPQEYTE